MTEAVSIPSTEELSGLAGQSAEVALPRLLQAYGGRLYNLALRFCGSPEDAEDLVQETFLLAFRKWHQFRGQARPTTWLYTIAARACRRRKRRRAGEPHALASLSDLEPFGQEPIADLTRPDDGPLDAQLRREARESVERALAELPTHYRMALILKDLLELPVADVAGILGLKQATVKTRVHRARLLLRQRLEETLPRREAPAALYSQRVCLDLLRAKQEALDRGAEFPVHQKEVCERCAALFATLDLTHDACMDIGRGELPPALESRLSAEIGGTA
ncbi:MAG: RNA polymerase sigma factor [bacterium]|nr:RNA polymerase sigma factor [bacterium]